MKLKQEKQIAIGIGILLAILSTGARAALSVNSFHSTIYNTNTATMDAALGITGFTIEDFGDTTLIPNLNITFSGNISTPVTYDNTLPALFDTKSFPYIDGFTSFNNNFWDDRFALANGGSGSNEFAHPFANLTTFSFTSGAISVGVGLANFQSLNTADHPITNHELLVNGVSLGILESLVGVNWSSGIETRNAYIRIDASNGDVINSIGFRNIINGDGLVFDHLAVNPVSQVPLPASFILFGSGLVGLLGIRSNKKNISFINERSFKPSNGMN